MNINVEVIHRKLLIMKFCINTNFSERYIIFIHSQIIIFRNESSHECNYLEKFYTAFFKKEILAVIVKYVFIYKKILIIDNNDR